MVIRVGSKVRVYGLETILDGTEGTVVAVAPDNATDNSYWITFDGMTAELIFDTYVSLA